MDKRIVRPWEWALLAALACAASIASGQVVRAQSPMRFQTIGVPMLNSRFAIVPQYAIVQIIAGVRNAQTTCAVIEPPLPTGVLPWVGLDTLPLSDGRSVWWIAPLPGGECQEGLFEVKLN